MSFLSINIHQAPSKSVALEWIKLKRGGWSQPHTEAVIRTLENNVFSKIGPVLIESITPPEVLKILRAIESRGSLEIAKKVLQRMNAIFRYAIQTGRATITLRPT